MRDSSTNPGTNEESQIDSGENEIVIAYTSKHLTDNQVKWSTTEKEAYAIVHTVKTSYHYLYGTDFTIVTDHGSLEYFMTKIEPTGRLARRALFLQPFNLHIKYRTGKSNKIADCLSRLPVNVLKATTIVVADWIEEKKPDTSCKSVFEEFNLPSNQSEYRKKTRDIQEIVSFQRLPNHLLASQIVQIVVPMKFREDIISRYHDHKLAGHLGRAKTLATIKAKYFWPRMVKKSNLI